MLKVENGEGVCESCGEVADLSFLPDFLCRRCYRKLLSAVNPEWKT